MSRSLSYLRRGLLGLAFLGSLGFGVTQAFAKPERVSAPSCPALYTLCFCEDGTSKCFRLPYGEPCPIC